MNNATRFSRSFFIPLFLAILAPAATSGQQLTPSSHLSPIAAACLGDQQIPLLPNVRMHGIDSPRFEGPLCYLVFLPPDGIRQDEKLPVIVLLHGLYGAPSSWLRSQWIFEKAMAERVLPRALVIIPDGRNGYWTNWTDGQHPFGDVVVEEYLQHVQRVYPRADLRPERTAIAGISMGGFGALSLGLLHPKHFGFVVGISGTDMDIATQAQPKRTVYTDPFGTPIQQQSIARVNPYHLVQKRRGKGQHFRIIYGDREHPKFSRGGARLLKAMRSKRLDVIGRVVRGGQHSWKNTWEDASIFWWIEELGIAWSEKPLQQAMTARAKARREVRQRTLPFLPTTCRLGLWRPHARSDMGAFELRCDIPPGLTGPCQFHEESTAKQFWSGARVDHLSCAPVLNPTAAVLPESEQQELYQRSIRMERDEWGMELHGICAAPKAPDETAVCDWKGLFYPAAAEKIIE